MKTFLLADGSVFSAERILSVDFSRVEELHLTVRLYDGVVEVTGIQAIELLMVVKPSALENRRLRWKRHAWAVHNLVGHPLMQFLAFFRRYQLAMWVHDITVPRPQGKK